MAGHSKFANIKHRKGAQDAKRGKIFTKIIKEITVAVKEGGHDRNANPRLRLAIQNGKSVNMPKDNIERAIKKACGNDGADYIEVNFEGYATSGVAIYIECTTDNHTRTVANVRSYFNKSGGNLGKDGCLQFVFERKGIFTIKEDNPAIGDIDEFSLEIIDAGAEDVEQEDGLVTITSALEDFGNIQKKLEELKVEPKEAGLERIPTNFKDIDDNTFLKVMKLVDILEDDDDIQKVYHNVEFKESQAALL